MPCCLVSLIALFAPRFAIFMTWLFSNYFDRAYQTNIWPVLGFLFMPYTMLAYAVAMNSGGGLQGIWLIVFVLGVLVDLGVVGGSANSRRRNNIDSDGLKRVN